ncbi:MAG: hypothetical protein KAJ19_28180 [Gammaproteobacteria bacterium]|nr:hypothetical protein [Gammaproteobacteria bacterium]
MMSRLYPLKRRVGWMRKKAKFPYAIQSNDGSTRIWYPHMEREPLTGMPEPEIEAHHAGHVLRDGIYVWSDPGMNRKKP